MERHQDIDHTCFEHLMKPHSKRSQGYKWIGYSAEQHITSGMAGVQHRLDSHKAAWKASNKASNKAASKVTITNSTDEKKTETDKKSTLRVVRGQKTKTDEAK